MVALNLQHVFLAKIGNSHFIKYPVCLFFCSSFFNETWCKVFLFNGLMVRDVLDKVWGISR